jgi:hypothetical protein
LSFVYDIDALTEDGEDASVSRIRFLLGDTDEATAHVQDEEILYLLSDKNGNERAAASAAAEHVAMRYAHEASFSAGPMRQELGERAERWRSLSAQLVSKHSGGVPVILEAGEKPRLRSVRGWDNFWPAGSW